MLSSWLLFPSAVVSALTVSPAPAFPQNVVGIDVEALAPLLSSGADIYFPGSDKFTNYTVRWSNLQVPTPSVVVVPGCEDDVVKTVKFAFEEDIPLFTYNGHHGTMTTLGRMDYGIQIYLPSLSTVSFAEDGQSVTVGGGINSKVLVDALWEAGKQTVTGTCECVSYLGPGLGGGHGWLQGYHGLISDQFMSMNVVLANGELKTIDSTSDLWWGMLGAGHNFGVVTSVTSQIYDLVKPNWAIETIIFSGDKVEAVYEAANEYFVQNGTQDPDIINWSYWLNDATLDAEKPVILMFIIQEGVDAVDARYTQPFHDIGPLVVAPQTGTYRDLAAWTSVNLDGLSCQDLGFSNPGFPVYAKSYNTTAQKALYEAYASATKGTESPYYNSICLFENYGSAGVRARASESTAFAFRNDYLLTAAVIMYNSTSEEVDSAAEQLGNELRAIVQDGTGSDELHSYVNYAHGNEGPKAWYGSEPWRQDRLKGLKEKYDPHGKFSFFGPIA